MDNHLQAEPKVFKDPIHGSIQIPEYCQMIIDTPEFQRLRYIKQLGCTSYVFPGATHTRFEHSVGTSHLAGELARALRQHEPDIQLNEIACVEIAGLCHDLGHGPFSHVFEKVINRDEKDKRWTHEKQSVNMFEHLVEKHGLRKKMEKFNIYKQELEFIRELILGGAEQSDQELARANKFYLYQIVNNAVSGVDVDKWDYLARDAHFLGMKSLFDFQRVISFVRVGGIESKDGVKQLCFRDKVASELNHMFLTRRTLHYTSYRHRVTEIIELMLIDALLAASKHLKFYTKDGKEYDLLECVKDPEAFCQLNDSVIHRIMHSQSSEEGMVKAREILDRIHNRQLYQCIIEIQHANIKLDKMDPNDRDEIKRCVMVDDKEDIPASMGRKNIWCSADLEITVTQFDYGKGGKNPLLYIPFYKKWQAKDGVKATFLEEDELPADVPKLFTDVTLRIFNKDSKLRLQQSDLESAKKHFEASTGHLSSTSKLELRTPSKTATCSSESVCSGDSQIQSTATNSETDSDQYDSGPKSLKSVEPTTARKKLDF